MDIPTMLDIDLALAEQVALGKLTAQERERQVERMAKYDEAQKGEGRVRADWETDDYVVAIISAKHAPNQFFMDADGLTAKYGEPVEGVWTNEKGERRYPDWPEDAQQWNLTLEVLEGEKKGDWLWVFCSPRFGLKKDGTWFGKAASIIGAIDKSELPANSTGPWALNAEDAWDEFMHRPFRVGAEPKADPQYAKVNSFMPVKKGYKAPAAPDATAKPQDPTIGDEEIPFFMVPRESLEFTRCGHSRW